MLIAEQARSLRILFWCVSIMLYCEPLQQQMSLHRKSFASRLSLAMHFKASNCSTPSVAAQVLV